MPKLTQAVEIGHQRPVGIELLRIFLRQTLYRLKKSGHHAYLCGDMRGERTRKNTDVQTPRSGAVLTCKKRIARLKALWRKKEDRPAVEVVDLLICPAYCRRRSHNLRDRKSTRLNSSHRCISH